ncbi:MarR family transcriptional regulator [Sphingobium sp. LB126]|uniref:MarR family transcriptional regulator n=2 Tax=Sphingobium chungbukense TaxID=56193 RepID=A0A0M3ANE2_9SPHN|nr:MarR family winged helix-turn-helix transcriptional regulator [Sphingobium sp. LB126]KKW91677.1 MarR family transcriptional regulator [Sphingobium chungbukense]PJG46771.1 MarR family transcriptional regulator [Sphingobium sp. LB126]
MARSGADLALLLLGGFRSMADAATAELSRRGFDDVRPAHEFALRAIAGGAGNASELGRRLAVTKQAAAKTVAMLEQRGYVSFETAGVSRRKRLQVTPRGHAMMKQGEAIFEELRAQWEKEIGSADLRKLEEILARLVGSTPIRLDTPGWIAQDATYRTQARPVVDEQE